MNKNVWMPKLKQLEISNVNKVNNIDDLTFSVWKSELQKELHSFWTSMIS